MTTTGTPAPAPRIPHPGPCLEDLHPDAAPQAPDRFLRAAVLPVT